MKLWYLLLVFVVARGADDWHSSDPLVVARKQRLLLASDPNDSSKPGGIRSRAGDQEDVLSDLRTSVSPVKRGEKKLRIAWKDVLPKLTGLAKTDKKDLESLNRLDRKLSKIHDTLEKRVGGFAQEWRNLIMAKAESDPTGFNTAFEPVNQAFRNEFKQLSRGISTAQSDIQRTADVIYKQNVATQQLQNKTANAIERRVKLGTFGIDQLLNRKALPLLVGTKYATAAQLANLGKASIDALDTLKDQFLADTSKQGAAGMDESAEVLKTSAQKSIAKAARNIQRSLSSMRADLNRLSLKQNTWMNRNYSDIETTLARAETEVGKARTNGTRTIQKQIDQASLISDDFKNNVLNTASDLMGTLTKESSVIGAIQQQAKLDAEQMNSGYTSRINSLGHSLKSAVSSGGSNVNGLQQQISSVYSAGSGETSKSISEQTRLQAAQILSDASDQSEQLGLMFQQVSADAQSVTGELGTRTGIASATVTDKQTTLLAKTDEMASSTMSEIDDATAENDADRANLMNRFQNSVMQMTGSVGASLNSIGSSIDSKSSALGQQTIGANEQFNSDLSKSQSEMASQVSGIQDLKQRLLDIPQQSLTQLDAQNEDRIRSAISELNALRQLSGNQGDAFQSLASSQIASLVSAVNSGSQLEYQKLNLTNLANQTSFFKNASISYQSNVDAFETSMSAEISKAVDALNDVKGSTGQERAVGQIVAHQQAQLADQGRLMIREIYNQSGTNSISRFVSTNPRLNVEKFLGSSLLNTSQFDSRYSKVLDAHVRDIQAKRAQTKSGIEQFRKFLESVKTQITSKVDFDRGDAAKLAALARARDADIMEILSAEALMNETIRSQLKAANESITNKTYNFFKQFQTASIVADSLVSGFGEYVDKMISVENASAVQREATQNSIIKSIQDHTAGGPLFNSSMNGTEIDRINQLVKATHDASDQSLDGARKRKAAQEALVKLVGVDAAARLQSKYENLASNAKALSGAIQASIDDMQSDRVSSLEAAKLGLDGVSAETQLFSKQADGLLDSQKKNANEIADKIDQLLTGGSFLTNMSADQLGTILASVQNSDGVFRSQISSYQDSNGASIATLGGTVEAFANLVETSLKRTTDYLDMLTKNYTLTVEKSDRVVRDPIKEIQGELKTIRDKAETINSTLTQHELSQGPIQEGLQERLESLNKRNDDFMTSINKQLNDYVTNIHRMDSDIAVSRQAGMQKLRSAMSRILNVFREQALELQSEKVDKTSLIEVGSDEELKQDMQQRIHLLRKIVNG